GMTVVASNFHTMIAFDVSDIVNELRGAGLRDLIVESAGTGGLKAGDGEIRSAGSRRQRARHRQSEKGCRLILAHIVLRITRVVGTEAETELGHHCRADDPVVRDGEIGIIRCGCRWPEKEGSPRGDGIETALVAEPAEYGLPWTDVVIETYIRLITAEWSGVV